MMRPTAIVVLPLLLLLLLGASVACGKYGPPVRVYREPEPESQQAAEESQQPPSSAAGQTDEPDDESESRPNSP